MIKKLKSKTGATTITFMAFAVLVALGLWQMQRLEWKNGLLAKMESQMAQKPAPLPEKIDNAQDWQYRRVLMAGSFIEGKEFLVGPRTFQGKAGYHLIVPFQRVSGGFVLVNRGWVSDETLAKGNPSKGLVQVEGVALLPVKSRHTPANVPEKNEWYWADLDAMSKAAGLKNVSPVMVQVTTTPAGVVPAGVPVAHDIRNDHRQYAFFWFGMAAVLLVVYFVYQRQEKKNASVQAA